MSQRSSVRWLGSSLLAAALVAAAAPAEAQARGRARVVGGVLSAPSDASPVAIAGAYLATRPEILGDVAPAALRVVGTRALTRGASVRYVQTHAGLDVLGGTVTVRLDAEGRVRWATGAPTAIPAGFDVTPVLTPEGAIATVQAEQRFHLYGAPMPASRHARLAIDASRPGGQPRLVYVITAPGNLALLEALRFRVDAKTGEILSVENLVRTGGSSFGGNVFPSNPTKTPALVNAPLADWIDSGQSAPVRLQGPDVKVLNCLDQMQCQDLMGINMHSCTQTQGAAANASGTFLDIGRPASDLDGEDHFAEVQMFYHVNRIYDLFRSFGFTDLDDQPLTAVVNQRLPIDLNDIFGSLAAAMCTNGVPQAGHELFPLDNALFTPDGSLFGLAGGAIVFGQGTGADFAYDGDVVYHEFTHAVMGTLTPDFGSSPLDELGYDPTGPGLGEGTADYFSSAMTGDPDVAEYAGPALAGGQFLRTLANDKTCPSSLWGEVHQDGEQWGGALWDIRSSLEAGLRDDFDVAVFNAISALTDTTDQVGAAALVVAEVTTALGAPAGTAAAAQFAARGLDDCDDRVIDLSAGAATKDVLFLGGSEIATPAPGPVQFKLQVPAGATKIEVSILGSQASGGGFGGGGTPPAVKLIVKPGAEPILWTYAGANASHDATATGDVTCGTAGNMPCTGAVAGPFTAGPHVVQLINAGGGAVLQQITFSTSDEALAPDAGPGAPDAGPGAPDAGPGGGGDGDDGGCGCRVGGQGERSPLGGGALALAGLAAFLMVVRRRR